jgi:P2 family phage contractile tail tube protein
VALVPERLVNFRCYGGTCALELLGMTDVEQPNFESMTETISGAGIAGEYASPVIGHFSSQTVKLKFRTVTAAALGLLAPVQHLLDIRGSIQVQDPMLGTLSTVPLRVEVRGQPKNAGLSKLEPGKPMDSDLEIECSVIRITLDGVPKIELDKFNMVFKVDGVDYLRGVRLDLGGV